MKKQVLIYIVSASIAGAACSGGSEKDSSTSSNTSTQTTEVAEPKAEVIQQTQLVEPKEEIIEQTTEEIKEPEPTTHYSDQEPEPIAQYSIEELSELSQKLNINVTNDDDINLFREIASWLSVPYKSAGVDKSGADCSGFVNAVFAQAYDIKLPRQTSAIYAEIRSIPKDEAKAGDLVFFQTDGKTTQTPNYLGIFLKDNRFAIMSSKGFKIENLETSYYKNNFVCVGRVK